MTFSFTQRKTSKYLNSFTRINCSSFFFSFLSESFCITFLEWILLEKKLTPIYESRLASEDKGCSCCESCSTLCTHFRQLRKKELRRFFVTCFILWISSGVAMDKKWRSKVVVWKGKKFLKSQICSFNNFNLSWFQLFSLISNVDEYLLVLEDFLCVWTQ